MPGTNAHDLMREIRVQWFSSDFVFFGFLCPYGDKSLKIYHPHQLQVADQGLGIC